MSFADSYLGRQKGIRSHITDPPSANLGFVVVIPVFCEPDIEYVLDSLWQAKRSRKNTEVILVINSPDNADERIKTINRETTEKTREWIRNHHDPSLRFFIIDLPDLPARDAGAGLARKAGMDEAILRFSKIGNPHGFLLSLDADSKCDVNYLVALEEVVAVQPDIHGFDLYFEHPVEGNEYAPEIYQSIAEYELHLRYVNQFLRFAGFPYAHHTVGSCFGVRADIYTAQGGMNKKKAGEDFYFLHKIIPLGHFTDIVSTKVIPSPRPSFRVPFGTGPAISKRISEGKEMLSYAPECFMELKRFFAVARTYYRNSKDQIQQKQSELPIVIREFLDKNNAVSSVLEINANTGSEESFISRFFRWFDAFRIVKFLNYSSKKSYPRVKVTEGATFLLALLNLPYPSKDARALLEVFRQLEKKTGAGTFEL